MKRTTRFFLLFILTISILQTVNLVAAVEAPTYVDYWTREAAITNANLKFSLSNTGNMKYVQQQVLKEFKPLSYEKVDENLTKYTAMAVWEVNVNFWTEYTVQEGVSYYESTSSAKWLQLDTADNWFTSANVQHYSLTANYNRLNYQSCVAGYDGQVGITASIYDLTPDVLDFGNTQIIVKTKSLTGVVSEATVLSSSQQPIGQYTNIVNEIGSVNIGSIAAGASYSEASTKCKDASTAVNTWLTTNQIGIYRQDQNIQTIRQGACTPPVVGSDVLARGLNVKLLPDVKAVYEPIKVRSVTLGVDVQDSIVNHAGIDPARTSSVSETTIADRIVAFQFKQYAIQTKIQVVAMIYAIAEITPVIVDKPTLELPDTTIEDYFWDSTIDGDTGTTITIYDNPGTLWWEQNAWWIILLSIVVLSVLVLIYTPLGPMVMNLFLTRKRSRR